MPCRASRKILLPVVHNEAQLIFTLRLLTPFMQRLQTDTQLSAMVEVVFSKEMCSSDIQSADCKRYVRDDRPCRWKRATTVRRCNRGLMLSYEVSVRRSWTQGRRRSVSANIELNKFSFDSFAVSSLDYAHRCVTNCASFLRWVQAILSVFEMHKV